MRAPLQDSFGRNIGDLRLSVTDRCNFRCRYCIPNEKVEWIPTAALLTDDELERLVRIFASFGVAKLRITGGEPLLRPRLAALLERFHTIDGIDELALTTNGQSLREHLPALRSAGLRRINISLDTLDPLKFRAMTLRDAFHSVVESIDAAKNAGFEDVKVNAVIIRGINDDEVLEFARFARENALTVRFIEFMPLDSGHSWSMDQVVSGEEIVRKIKSAYTLVAQDPRTSSETAKRFRFADSAGEIGVIASVSAPFCGNCNRLRVTSDGQLRTCLFSRHEYDLRGVMRAGASDDELAEFISQAVWRKEAGHRIGQRDFVQPERTMSFIGG